MKHSIHWQNEFGVQTTPKWLDLSHSTAKVPLSKLPNSKLETPFIWPHLHNRNMAGDVSTSANKTTHSMVTKAFDHSFDRLNSGFSISPFPTSINNDVSTCQCLRSKMGCSEQWSFHVWAAAFQPGVAKAGANGRSGVKDADSWLWSSANVFFSVWQEVWKMPD